MNRFYYDLHIHSCLSPCADDDMTVNNIAGMAAIKGLNIIALTDHNSCANCGAFFKACKRQGVIPVPGMELTTAEDIHLLCLFPSLESAEEFESAFDVYRSKIKNKEEIFGNQLVLDENDGIIGVKEYLLPPASALSLEDAYGLVNEHGGYCWPAHIDRPSNGLIGVLGGFPERPRFDFVELSANAAQSEYPVELPDLEGRRVLKSSDAHHLWDISEAENYIDLEDEPYSGDLIRQRLFDFLKGENA
ncbi:MAG: PHP domain-containing protein [Clostridia bacterium]|nr:PHP domain-containing protein [Clostridia bacterium]